MFKRGFFKVYPVKRWQVLHKGEARFFQTLFGSRAPQHVTVADDEPAVLPRPLNELISRNFHVHLDSVQIFKHVMKLALAKEVVDGLGQAVVEGGLLWVGN
jgi:hypothetical protein